MRSTQLIQINEIIKRKKIEIEGFVQGIGFRPFIYKLAKENFLNGFVFNESGRVIIEIQGIEKNIENFLQNLQIKKPKLAKINSIKIYEIPVLEDNDFIIKESIKQKSSFSDILPDIALCGECLKELFDPLNKRYLYPFINCTNCGPRYTIIFDHPYDRINTTMSSFEMCESCQAEYKNPENRRFHAEPISCPECGPEILLYSKNEYINQKEPKIYKNYSELLKLLTKLLEQKNILAIKGIGGYHICCSIEDPNLIKKLRLRKKRKFKPFAVMFPNIKEVQKLCEIDSSEIELLKSSESPIVLVKLKKEQIHKIPKEIIPDQNYLGVFLPYSPIHHLIMKFYNKPLIMTSANFSSEPIIYKEEWDKLFEIADYVLSHNREIYNYCDDSVISKSKNFMIIHRNGRGYTPKTFSLRSDFKILGLGSELKNTISILHKDRLITSPYIGDLENYDTFEHQLKTIQLFQKIYNFYPDYFALDFHPEYQTTKWAMKNIPHNKLIFVQHHHSHLVSCMFENQIDQPVFGISLDGTGFGITKNHPKICGAEIYLVNYKNFQHLGSIHPIKLIGGDKAIKKIERIGFSLLYEVYKRFYNEYNLKDFIKKYYEKFLYLENYFYYEQMIEKNIQIVEATSCGRLFDGVSYLLGLCDESDYEGHPAITLEQVLYLPNFKTYDRDFYEYEIYQNHENKIYYLDWRKSLKNILYDIVENKNNSLISNKFHNTIIYGFIEILNILRKKYKINKIVLSGGAFQNQYLLDNFYQILTNQNYEVYFHKALSPNDENISVGQIIVANEILSSKE